MASQPGYFNVQEFTDLGALAAGYRLYTYAAGTTTLKTAYTDSAASIPHTYTDDGIGGQYIALNARGEVSGNLYLASGAYDLVLKDTSGVSVWRRTAVGADDSAATLDTALRADLALNSSATKGAGMVGYSESTAYTGGVGLALKQYVNVRNAPFNAKGDGTTDDTTAIQAAINYVRSTAGGVLYFPPNDAAQFYKVTAPLTIDGSIHILGAGQNAVTIMGTGMFAGQYVVDVNCDSANNVENLSIQGLTIRSNNGTPHGLRIKNASYVLCKRLRLYNFVHGVVIEGTRCFSNSFEQVQVYTISGSGVRMQSSFSGGGDFLFHDCTFTGDTGFILDTTSATDGLTFHNCNFESYVTNGLYIGGNVAGLTFSGCRTEAGGGDAFQINPAATKKVTGLSVTGCFFDAASAAYKPIALGGAGGTVRGFFVAGNSVNTMASGSALVYLNGEGLSGVVCGNRFVQSNAQAVNMERAGVYAFANENGSGGCLEYWGLMPTPAAATTIASATTIAPTSRITFVSGTTTIQTITAPSTLFAGGGQITLIPTGAWATNTAGNIANVITATANVPVLAVYDPTTTKWYVK